MYEELVERLRSHSGWALNKTLDEAADAIEELSSAGSIYGKAWTLGYDAGRDENMPHWILVTERLPEPGWYLVRCNEVHKHIHRIAYYYNCYNPAWYEDSNNITECVTHWMPLPSAPEPPKEET